MFQVIGGSLRTSEGIQKWEHIHTLWTDKSSFVWMIYSLVLIIFIKWAKWLHCRESKWSIHVQHVHTDKGLQTVICALLSCLELVQMDRQQVPSIFESLWQPVKSWRRPLACQETAQGSPKTEPDSLFVSAVRCLCMQISQSRLY